MAFVYSCCFWFSLRLGGILIGIYSTGLLVLTVQCLGYTQSEKFKTKLTELTEDMRLIYIKEYVDNIKNGRGLHTYVPGSDLDNITQCDDKEKSVDIFGSEQNISDPERYFTLSIATTSFYLIVCLIFIYGAYTCNNVLMIPYLILDLTRLIMLSVLVATALLVLKQNTMDIGLLIGASVAGGFFLLGEFYLWVCAANLPILINEMERDEQAATIEKLQQLLQMNSQRTYTNTLDSVPLSTDYGNDVFIVPRNRLRNRTKIPAPFANNYNIRVHR